MADVHLFQWVVAWGSALWVTTRWLLARPQSRWRHIAGGLVATLLWIPVAYTAGNVYVVESGTREAFGSQALGSLATFMVVVCIAGLLVGLVLWVEEAADEASQDLPAAMRRGDPRRGDD